jgi:hypothetical protein
VRERNPTFSQPPRKRQLRKHRFFRKAVMWRPRRGFESRPRPLIFLSFSIFRLPRCAYPKLTSKQLSFRQRDVKSRPCSQVACKVVLVRYEWEPQAGHLLRGAQSALIVTAERVTFSRFARSITFSKSSARKLIDIRESVIHRMIISYG